MSSAGWCQVYKDRIMSALSDILPSEYELVWKTTPSRLKQDGYDIHSENKVECDDPVSSSASSNERANDDDDSETRSIIGYENGIKYITYPFREIGQKTSVYCDQRDNRYSIAQYCKNTSGGKNRVLDLCCYHGGFTFNSILNGNANYAIGVDSSQDAIDTCIENAKLNDIQVISEADDRNDDDTNPSVQFVQSDISDYMKEACDKPQFFDVVILDPPKLAPSMSSLTKASRKYHSLNRDALKLINEDKGGFFMTCTCSAAMTQKDGGSLFLQMIQQASLAAKRDITLLKVNGAASCHTQAPASFPAGNYLTVALFHVAPK